MLFERRCPGCERKSRFVCEPCLSNFVPSGPVGLEGLDQVVAGFDYSSTVRACVLAAKSAGRRDLLRWFAKRLVSLSAVASPDVVTWVPAAPGNRRDRGFDQGLVLARAVGDGLGVPTSRLISRSGLAQVGRDRGERLEGIELWQARLAPRSVLVVDDVVTTGTSLRAAADVVRKAGAQQVSALTIASTGWPAQRR